MSISYNSKMTSFSKPRQARTDRPAKAATLNQCLIVSADPARQSMFVQSAVDGGWETFTCADPASAETCLARNFVQLAIVDLEGEQSAEFQHLLDRLRLTSGLLLIVCGNEGNVEEEVFVRQLGPWLYLPGVDQGADITSLCCQARKLSDRRRASEPSLPPSSRTNLRRSG
jgi:hypothetical protein